MVPYDALSISAPELALLTLHKASDCERRGPLGDDRCLFLRESGALAHLCSIITGRQNASNWPFVQALQLLEHAASQNPEIQMALTPQDPHNLGPSLIPSLLTTVASSVAPSPSMAQPPPAPTGAAVSRSPGQTEVLGGALRVLINLTHHNPPAVALVVGHGLGAFLDVLVFHSNVSACEAVEKGGLDWLLEDEEAPSCDEADFDLILLALNALTNCVEISSDARTILSSMCVGSESVCVYLTGLLNLHSASFADELSKDMSGEKGGDAEDGDWAVEGLVMCGYIALLSGCLLRGHPENRAAVEADLGPPGVGGLQVLVRILKAFVAFQSTAGVLTAEGAAPVLALIEEVQGGGALDQNEPTATPASPLDVAPKVPEVKRMYEGDRKRALLDNGGTNSKMAETKNDSGDQFVPCGGYQNMLTATRSDSEEDVLASSSDTDIATVTAKSVFDFDECSDPEDPVGFINLSPSRKRGRTNSSVTKDLVSSLSFHQPAPSLNEPKKSAAQQSSAPVVPAAPTASPGPGSLAPGSWRSSQSPASALQARTYRRLRKPFVLTKRSERPMERNSIGSSHSLEPLSSSHSQPTATPTAATVVATTTVASTKAKPAEEDGDVLFGSDDELSILGWPPQRRKPP